MKSESENGVGCALARNVVRKRTTYKAAIPPYWLEVYFAIKASP